MTETDFFDELQARLGGNLIDVELTYPDFRVAFNLATLTYRTKGNDNLKNTFYAISVDSSSQTYTLPTEIDEIIEVVDAAEGNLLSSGTSADPFALAFIQSTFSGLGIGGVSLVNLELYHQQLETVGNYTVSDQPFIFDRVNHQVTFLKHIGSAQNWLLEVYSRMTDEEYRDVLWIKEFALAEAKIMLGRAYQKYATLTTPSGETNLNGEQLIADGKEDKDRLLEDIKNFTDTEDAIGGIIFLG